MQRKVKAWIVGAIPRGICKLLFCQVSGKSLLMMFMHSPTKFRILAETEADYEDVFRCSKGHFPLSIIFSVRGPLQEPDGSLGASASIHTVSESLLRVHAGASQSAKNTGWSLDSKKTATLLGPLKE